MIIVFVSSCANDFDPNIYGETFPVVYGCICPEDSMLNIRLNRSFVGQDNAYEIGKIYDSIYFEDAVVQLSLYLPDNEELLFQKTLNRTLVNQYSEEDSPKEFNKFIYSIPIDELPSIHFSGGLFFYRAVLTVYIPSTEITCYAETNIYEKPWPKFPTLSHSMYLDLYSETSNNITWFSRGDKHQELYVHFNYLEIHPGRVYEKTAILKYRIPEPLINYSRTVEYRVKHIFYAETFWNRLNIAIKEDPDVKYRKFVDMDFEIISAGPEYHKYINLNPEAVDYDLNNFTSNIINGRGRFFSKRKLLLKGHKLHYKTLDSLAQSPLTSKLKFVKY